MVATGKTKGPKKRTRGRVAGGNGNGRLRVEYVPIGRLRPFKGNPRKNAETVGAIVRSIEHYGYTNPILARRANGEIIAGHTRYLALKERGEKQVPVIFLDLTVKQARAYGVFDNKSTENTPWDVPVLVEQLEKLAAGGVELEDVGFTADDLADLSGKFTVDSADMPTLSKGNRAPFQQVTFTLHDEQVALLKKALEKAKAAGPFAGSPNENSNGNALARIAEAYCGAS